MAYSVNTYSVKKWDLGELFPGFDSPELQAAFDNVEEQVTSFEGVRGKLKPDMDAETFLDIVRASEETARILNKVYAFAGLSFAEDTQDQNAQSLMGRVQQFVAEIQNRTLFFNLWWKDLDEANAKRLMDASGDYRYYLEEMRHFKPHTLSEAEEKVVNLKDVTGSSALINLYDCDHESLCLQAEGERRRTGTDPRPVAALHPGTRTRPARQGLSGTLPGLWRGRSGPRADVPDPRPRLAQRKHHHAQIQQSHVGAQSDQRHSR